MGNPQGYNCDCAAFGLAFVLAELCCGDFHSKWLTRMEDSHAHNKHFPTGCHLPPFPPTRSDCSYRLWQMQVLKFPYSEVNFPFRYFLVRTYYIKFTFNTNKSHDSHYTDVSQRAQLLAWRCCAARVNISLANKGIVTRFLTLSMMEEMVFETKICIWYFILIIFFFFLFNYSKYENMVDT